jgi:hypothetical protein
MNDHLKHHPFHIRAILLATVMMTAVIGCRSIRHQGFAPIADVDSGIRQPAPDDIGLIENPKNIREDSRYPESTKQQFFWKSDESEWRFKLPANGYSHAGFRFRIPFNLSHAIDEYELIFTLKPAGMVQHLWVGLIDGNDKAPNLLTDISMSGYTTKGKAKDTVDVRIPLRNFPTTGTPVDINESAENSGDTLFDWQDVLGIRFIHNGGRIPAREVLITNLRIKR